MRTFLLSIIIFVTVSSSVKALTVARDGSTSSVLNSTNSAFAIPTVSNSSSEYNINHGGSYWLESIKHQGNAAFRSDSGYQVFRNVKDFGARGDGISDDTLALNTAISNGRRCDPGSCGESSTSPALVYIPGGTYLVSAPIIDYYYTQIIGNPNNRPILKAIDNFTGSALIDSNMYNGANSVNMERSLPYKRTNAFYRQIRNLILDTTAVVASSNIKVIYWPAAQATSLENILIRMNDQNGTQHQGLVVESGSGGVITDLEFHGGHTGALMASQQIFARNLWFYDAVEAIEQIFDWGSTYKSLHIVNCTVGLNMTNADPEAQNVGSIVVLDSFFVDNAVGIATSHDSNHWSVSNGSLILENVGFENVQMAVEGTQGWTALPTNSGNLHVQAWGIGHEYAQQGPQDFLGTLPAVSRVGSLTAGSDNGTYYERSKPDYRDVPVHNIFSVKAMGAKGDGVADDTEALQNVLDQAGTNADHVVFFDAGTYRVTKTLRVPKVCKLLGESYATIMSNGNYFANMADPQPVVQVGRANDVGCVEWSDMIVSTQGPQAGAILIEWNVAATGQPSGMWDVHTRIGGFVGSKLGAAECPASRPTETVPLTSPRNKRKREAALQARFRVGFSVYEGVATPTYLASGIHTPKADSSPPQSPISQPTPTPSPMSSISDISLSSIDIGPVAFSAPSSPSLPFTTTLATLVSPTPLAFSIVPIDTEWMASSTLLADSTSASDSTFVASIPPLSSQSPAPMDTPSIIAGPLASSTLSLSSSYNLTSQQQPDASNSSLSSSVVANGNSSMNDACVGAFMSMHISKSASGVYMENVWLSTAEHDLDAALQNITIYSGRGLLVESENGNIWMAGTSSEHHSLYQYQFSHTQSIVLHQMQSETALYQQNPNIETPFTPVESLNDPDTASLCKNRNGSCDGYGLRILESQHLAIYGAGLYSFFTSNNGSCALDPSGRGCQQSIFSIEGSCTDITTYNLNTAGVSSMVDRDGTSLAKYSDNVDVFSDTIALFRLY